MLNKVTFTPARPWCAKTHPSQALFTGYQNPQRTAPAKGARVRARGGRVRTYASGFEDTAGSPTRRRAQTCCSLFLAACASPAAAVRERAGLGQRGVGGCE